MWDKPPSTIRVIVDLSVPKDTVYFTDEPSIKTRTRALWRRQAKLHDVFDPPEPVRATFSEVLKDVYMKPLIDQMRQDANQQMLWFGQNVRSPRRGLCHKPFFLARLHDWGPVETSGGYCYNCEGLGFLSEFVGYEDSCTGLIDCDVCDGTGMRPRVWSRTCERCNHTETKRECG